jgi:hypothetical protein
MIGFTPTTSGDWNTVPTQSKGALDTLASSGVVKSQAQNLVLASPNGSSGLPTIRALVSADIPVLPYSSSTLTSAHILVGNGSNVATDVAVSGEASIANTGAVTLTNSAVIGKVLTAYSSGAGTVSATDTILQAIQKLNGNDDLALAKASNLSDVANKATSFNNLSPMTTSGDIIYGGASGTGTRLAKGSDGQVLTLASGLPTWAAAGGSSIGAWTGYTPTFSNLGTVTSINARYRLVGTSLDIEIFGITGTTVAAEFRVTLPGSYAASLAGAGYSQAVGIAYVPNNTNAGATNTNTVLAANGNTYLTINAPANTALGLANGNSFSNTAPFTIKAMVEVV